MSPQSVIVGMGGARKSVRPEPLQPPGPRGHWLLGNLADYRRDRLRSMEDLRREYGTVVGYRLGSMRFVLLSEPQLLHEVLVARNKEFVKSFTTRTLGQFFGQGLFISEGPRWLKDRRTLQPTFAKEQVQFCGEAMVRHTAAFAGSWRPGEQRDALLDMQTLTMSIAADTLLGVQLPQDIAAIHEPHELIRQHLDRKLSTLWSAPNWLPTPYNRRLASANATIMRLVDDLIQQRRQEQRFGPDVLSRLMQVRDEDGRPLSNRQVRDQALTFLFAGHETTASSLAWLWYLVGKHPDVEEALYAEVDTVLGGRTPTIADVPHLPCIERVVRETLRLYPSVYTMGREASADCELGGYRISRGTTLIMSQWLLHRDERFYDRPLDFLPDRWTADLMRRHEPFAWFPFGAGPRVCIGNTFALLEMVLVVATIASRWRLRLEPGQRIEPQPSVTLRPSPGVQIICEPRRHR
jgi:cytochrome P450